jgi:hypothetical protein
MAVNHAEGPILLQVSTDGAGDFLVEARFNGSEAIITSATDADRATAIGACITALGTTFPWGDLTELPMQVINKVTDYRTR